MVIRSGHVIVTRKKHIRRHLRSDWMRGYKNTIKLILHRLQPLFDADLWMWEWYITQQKYMLDRAKKWLYIAHQNKLLPRSAYEKIIRLLHMAENTTDINMIADYIYQSSEIIREEILKRAIYMRRKYYRRSRKKKYP